MFINTICLFPDNIQSNNSTVLRICYFSMNCIEAILLHKSYLNQYNHDFLDYLIKFRLHLCLNSWKYWKGTVWNIQIFYKIFSSQFVKMWYITKTVLYVLTAVELYPFYLYHITSDFIYTRLSRKKIIVTFSLFLKFTSWNQEWGTDYIVVYVSNVNLYQGQLSCVRVQVFKTHLQIEVSYFMMFSSNNI